MENLQQTKINEPKTNKIYYFVFLALITLAVSLIAAKFFIIPQYFPNSSMSTVMKEKVEKVLGTKDNESIEALSLEQYDLTLNSNVYDLSSITTISNFEKTEASIWQGNGIYDEKIFYEGKRSLGIISTDRKAATVTLEKIFGLSDMEYIEFMLHVSDADAFESAMIDFGSSDLKSFYRYSFTNLKNGWNLIQIPKEKFILSKAKDAIFDWSNIEKARFYVLSRPDSIFLIRLDMLRCINNSDTFINDWDIIRGKEKMFLSLYKKNDETILLARSKGSSMATLKEIENKDNFSFSTAISPQGVGRSGLFVRGNYNNGYGYYFGIYGDKRNAWRIFKRNKKGWTPKEEIVEGTLENITFSKDKEYWLRADVKGNAMKFYLSFDGENYEKLGELVDDEFRSGGVGIFVLDGSWSLFDDFRFKEL